MTVSPESAGSLGAASQLQEQSAGRQTGEPRFLADEMLGGLARWLRVVGYDTASAEVTHDSALVRRAVQDQRILLTRDRSLADGCSRTSCMVLQSDDPREQLREVVIRFGLDWRSRLFTRCTVCNHLLQTAEREEVAGRVPLRVLEEHQRFSRCPSCERVYWQGSHAERMRLALERALGLADCR